MVLMMVIREVIEIMVMAMLTTMLMAIKASAPCGLTM